MKRIVTVVLALALVGYLGCGAFAADQSMPASGQPAVSGGSDSGNMGSGMVKEGSEKIAVSGAANYGTLSGNSDAYLSLFMVQGEYGYMVCDQFEMAARAIFALAQTGSAGSTERMQAYSIVFVPKWRIPMEGNIAPYIGPKFGAAYVTGSGSSGLVTVGKGKGAGTFHDSVFVWGAVAGADIFLSKHTSLFVELDYTQFKLNSHDLGGGDYTVKDVGLDAGLAYWW